MDQLKRFLRDDDGLETVEYAILTGMIVVATIGTILLIGAWVSSAFTTTQSQLP